MSEWEYDFPQPRFSERDLYYRNNFAKIQYSFGKILKFGQWAEALPADVDIVDYWYNLFLSETKRLIEEDPMNNINAFHWNRWRNDFETYVDKYRPIKGEGYSGAERSWYGQYMQYLVYSLQIESKKIAEFYGKAVFEQIMGDYFQAHCCGVDWYIDYFIRSYGKHPEIVEIVPIRM